MLVALVAVVAAVALAMLGNGGALPDAEPDRLDDPLPAQRPVRRADLEALRIAVTLRGYRMSDVDDVLDRLGAELDERDTRIAELEAALAGAHDAAFGGPQLGGQQVPGQQYGGPGHPADQGYPAQQGYPAGQQYPVDQCYPPQQGYPAGPPDQQGPDQGYQGGQQPGQQQPGQGYPEQGGPEQGPAGGRLPYRRPQQGPAIGRGPSLSKGDPGDEPFDAWGRRGE